MEQSTQASSRTPSLILSPYLLIVCVMVSGFTAVSVGMRALAGYTASSSNPFAAFADILPGQPRSTVVARGFSCPLSFFFTTDRDVTGETCILNLETGGFRQVQVAVSHGVIFQTVFMMRGDSLRLGDLVPLWGTPQVREFGQSAWFFWPNSGVAATAVSYSGQLSPFLPARTVSFTDTRVLG